MPDNDEQTRGGGKNILGAALNRLPPKLTFILFSLGLLLFSAVLTVAVYKGSEVDLFGIKIRPGSSKNLTAGTNIPTVRLNIRFDPDDINPRDSQLQVMAFKQTLEGKQVPLLSRKGVEQGGIYVDLELPDMETPFFVVIESPDGIWKTEDISLKNSFPTAYKISN